ncbi:MAG: hypothetical protein L3J97_01500 [Thermoplasmata archaeon]|nr:hypothetical protein [Thermoplasmata archaeon]
MVLLVSALSAEGTGVRTSPSPELALRPGRIGQLLGFLRRHPVLCLFLLTPGLVEYLSGSSSFVYLVVSPAWFFLALGINAAMYTSGALLIREAWIRWNKGWPTVFALGAAYAIMEEGIADQTIFNPFKSPLGPVGTYGHFLGINWVWLPMVFYIHILMSLLVPILLLNLALPETRGQSLLSLRQIRLVLGILALDTTLLTLIVARSNNYWYGSPLLVGSIVAIAGFCVLGRVLPRTIASFTPGPPTSSRLSFFLVGCFAYPGMVVVSLVGSSIRLPPSVVFLAVVAILLACTAWMIRGLGTEANERHLLAFALGLMMIGFPLGLLTEFPLEFVLVADVVVLYFFYRLDQRLKALTPSTGTRLSPILPTLSANLSASLIVPTTDP